MPTLDIVRDKPFSTAQFYEELAGVDYSNDPNPIRAYSVDLDPISFLSEVSVGGVLTTVAGEDGLLSHVRDDPEALPDDLSASSRFFALHCDGIYLSRIPEVVVLHCIDPGASEMPTVFVDTKDIIACLGSIGRLEEANSYEFTYTHRHISKHTRPLIDVNPVTGEPMITTVASGDKSHLHPIDGSGKTQKDADEFSVLLEEVVTDGVPQSIHTWQANDTIVFDNLRLVHGRGLREDDALKRSDIQRHLLRIWLSRNREGATSGSSNVNHVAT